MLRAENRKFHFTYKVTCINTAKVFYGIASADSLDDKFMGTGHALSISKSEHKLENHAFCRLDVFDTRLEAKISYAKLKASELINAKKPSEYMFHLIYKIIRTDGKFYIGVHSTNNMHDTYMGSGIHIQRSIKKHGREKHVREILEICNSREDAFGREAEIVNADMLLDPQCMNKTIGGNGDSTRVYGSSDDTRKLISEKGKEAWAAGRNTGNLGKKSSPESIAKRVQKTTGKKRTDEQLANMSAGQLLYTHSTDTKILEQRAERAKRGAVTRLEQGTNLGGRTPGTPCTQAQKDALSAASKGRIFSEDHKLKLKTPKTRASCIFCKRETIVSHLSRYHQPCTFTDISG